jgi:hypothetical protein
MVAGSICTICPPAGQPQSLPIRGWWRVADRPRIWTDQPGAGAGVDRVGGERELCLLAAGQLANLLPQRDAQVCQPGLGVPLVPAPLHITGQVQGVARGQGYLYIGASFGHIDL